MRKLGRGIRNFAIVWLAWQAFIGTGYVIYSFVTGSYASAMIALSLVLISVGLSGTLWKWSGYAGAGAGSSCFFRAVAVTTRFRPPFLAS